MTGTYNITRWFFILSLSLSVSSTFAEDQSDFRTRISALITSPANEADVNAELDFGREVAARILGRFDGITDQNLLHYTNLVGQTLVQYSGRSDISFYFYILQSDSINAYATPGGYIFITTAALEAMQDESELAAVLAHEIAHVTQKHIVNALNIKGVDSSAGLSQMLGGASETARIAFGQAVGAAMDALFEQGLQSDDEFEADQVALFMLANAGYDTMALTRYLQRIAAANPDNLDVVSKTHPDFKSRLETLEFFIAENQLDSMDLPKLQARFVANIK